MTLLRLGNGGDSDDGAGLFSVIGKSAVGNEADDLRVVVVEDAGHGIFYRANELGNVANPARAVSGSRWLELTVGPEMTLGPGENEND